MSTTLSEKAKGKQRAVEPPPAAPLSKDLTIRFTEGIPDLTVQVAEKDTVKDVKNNVRSFPHRAHCPPSDTPPCRVHRSVLHGQT